MRRRMIPWILGAAVLLTGCWSPRVPHSAPVPHTLRIATATSAGVYYPVGQAMAAIWAESNPELQTRVLRTAGGLENIELLLQGEADVAFVQSGVLYAVLNDEQGAKRNRDRLSGLTYLYPNVIHLVVRRDAGIKTPQDLRGKRLIPGLPGSAAVANAAEVLACSGLSLEDAEVHYLGYSEAATAVREGRADAAVIPGGVPTEAVRAMLQGGQAALLPLDAAGVVQRHPWYLPYTIPAGSYPEQDEEVETVAVANVLIARSDLPADLVYQLVRALYQGREGLRQAHPAANLEVDEALRGITGVVPLHPGAERYMREAGILP